MDYSPKQAVKSSREGANLQPRRVFLGILIGGFTALNMVVFGRRNGWWAPTLKLSVTGPFEHEGPKYFGLKSPPDFVLWPFSVRVSQGRSSEIYVRYEYLKDVDAYSTAILHIRLKDTDGNVYYEDQGKCANAANDARNYKKRYPGSRLMLMTESGIRFDIPEGILERVKQIDLEFVAI